MTRFELDVEALQGRWRHSSPDVGSVTVRGEVARFAGTGEVVRIEAKPDGPLEADGWVVSEESTATEILWTRDGGESCYWHRPEDGPEERRHRAASRLQACWRRTGGPQQALLAEQRGRRQLLRKELRKRSSQDNVLSALALLAEIWELRRYPGQLLPYLFMEKDAEGVDEEILKTGWCLFVDAARRSHGAAAAEELLRVGLEAAPREVLASLFLERAAAAAAAAVGLRAQAGTALLLASVRNGHLAATELLLESGTAPDFVLSDGRSILHLACRIGYKGPVQQMLRLRAAVDTAAKDGATALHNAAAGGSEGLVRLFQCRGLAVDAAMEDGAAPLHLAAQGGHEAAARLLLDAGASANAAKSSGSTALHLASLHGHEAVAQLLLKCGASVHAIAAPDGAVPLALAAGGGHAAVVRMLLDCKAAPDASKSDGTLALHEASAGGHAPVVRLLLDCSASVDAAKKDGSTALQVASSSGHAAAAKVLLERGATAEAAGGAALLLASRGGHEEVVQALLDHRASVNGAAEAAGGSPLLVASALGHDSVARLLRERSASFGAPPQPEQLVRALVEGGVSEHEVTPEIEALGTACWSSQDELAAALEAACGDRQEALLGSLLSDPAAADGQQTGSDDLQGDWLGADGLEVAAIRGGAILWRGGPASPLQEEAGGSLSSSIEGWGQLRASRGAEGQLVWSDGDVWTRAPTGGGATPSADSPTAILLVRHGERLDDAVWAQTGVPWVPTAERPWDPPLTARGRLQALSLGWRVRHVVRQLGLAPLSKVFTSSYVRCFETAALAARAAGVDSVSMEPSLSEGLVEEFWRSWAVPGADGSWGGPARCGMGKRVAARDLRPEAHGTVGDLVPPERLQSGCLGSAVATIDSSYEPFVPFAKLGYTWGNFESEEGLEARMRAFFDFVADQYPGQTVMLVSHSGPTWSLFRSVLPDVPMTSCGYCSLHLLRRGASGSWDAPSVPRQPPSTSRAALGASKAVGMAMELFAKFDEDQDGFWCLREASRLVMATLGIKLPPQMFLNILAVSAAKDGDVLQEEDVIKGLSKDQVILLYTEPRLKRIFGSVLDLRRDHAIVFQREQQRR